MIYIRGTAGYRSKNGRIRTLGAIGRVEMQYRPDPDPRPPALP